MALSSIPTLPSIKALLLDPAGDFPVCRPSGQLRPNLQMHGGYATDQHFISPASVITTKQLVRLPSSSRDDKLITSC